MRRFKLKLNTKNFEISMMINVFIAVIILSSASYVYFVLNSISNTIEREKINKEISSVGIKISSIESNYLKIRSGISMEIANRQGFKENFNDTNFANIDSGIIKGRFSFLGNEI